MPFRLEDENDSEAKYDEQEKENAFPSPRILLIPSGHLQLLYGLLEMNRGLFDVVFNAVKKGALIYHEDGEIFEKFRK